ncbi:hypothetical protein WJ968_18610 [Achromobacter xylosoxidans]
MAVALCAVPVLAAERVDIPGYEARAGAQYRYRVQKTTETDMSSWPGAPVAAPVVMRGDFLLSATVLTRDEAGLRMRWDLSADLPADATGGAGAYPLNALYGGTLAAYGLRQLEIDTDPTGTPTARARRRRDHRHAGTDPGRDRTGRSRRAAGQRRPARAGNDQGQPAGHRRRAGARKRDARAGAILAGLGLRHRPGVDRAGQRRHPGRSHRHRHDMAAGRLRPGQPARHLQRAPGL